MKIRKILPVMLALCLALSMLAAAQAGTSTETTGSSLMDRINKVPAFKFWIHKDGIGYGNCPVYTAPSADAYRCANGKASCFTNDTVDEAGFVGGWLLVRYETNNGGYRVGYIPPKYVKGFQSKMRTPQFDYIPVTAADTIRVTDNPKMQNSSFATLDYGETFYILGKYTYIGDWWYIECVVDGQVARGFIDRGTSSFDLPDGSGSIQAMGIPSQLSSKGTEGVTGFPSESPLGTTQIGTLGVTGSGAADRKMVRQNADPDSKLVTVAYPGIQYPYYAVKRGTTGKDWYYIWVDADSAWGWISSNSVAWTD